MSTCKQWREGDENVCTCGYRWDVKDEDPHPKEPTANEKLVERNKRRIAKLKETLKR